MRQLQNFRITIIGLGLMGGSLAAALSTYRVQEPDRSHDAGRDPSDFTITAVARREISIEQAMEQGWIDKGTCDPLVGVRDADLVILATPVRSSIELLRRLSPHLKAGCIVSDLGSTKSDVMGAMSELPVHIDVIGGHPMCGKETAGLDAAEPDLFQGRVYVLTPLERTSPGAIQVMQQIIQIIGAQCLVLDAQRHDRLVAAISHLPYLVAACLVNTTEDLSQQDQLLWELASSGFRDTSRLAASEVTMMRDILMTNRENIRHMIHEFQNCLMRFDTCLAKDDEGGITEIMSISHRRREGMFR